MGAGIPPEVLWPFVNRQFHIPEIRNINIMSHLYIFALCHTFRKFRNNDGLLDGLRFRSSKEHVSSAGDRLSTVQANSISKVTLILSFS